MSNPERTGDTEQSFLSHLLELRSRLLKAVAAVLIILIALLPLANQLYALAELPTDQLIAQRDQKFRKIGVVGGLVPVGA